MQHNKIQRLINFLSNIIPVIKSRSLKWAGHVAHMSREEMHTGFWWGNLREEGHFEEPGVERRIILY
jgi:hypothetical protein